MKINDYEFHKKFYNLVRWCRPYVDYRFTVDAYVKYKNLLITHGQSRQARNAALFRCSNGAIRGPYAQKEIKYIVDLNSFATAIGIIFTYAYNKPVLADALAELVLDISNLEPVR